MFLLWIINITAGLPTNKFSASNVVPHSTHIKPVPLKLGLFERSRDESSNFL
jgi:hypothetical protein